MGLWDTGSILDHKQIQGMPSPGNPPLSSQYFVFSALMARQEGLFWRGGCGGGREGVLHILTGFLFASGTGGGTCWGRWAVAKLDLELVRIKLLICSLGRGTGSGGQRNSHQLLLNLKLGKQRQPWAVCAEVCLDLNYCSSSSEKASSLT